jgi:hypothetical protein
MREQNERERMEKENALRQMKQKEEQKDREIAELRNQLSRASLTPQVNNYGIFIGKIKFQYCSKIKNKYFFRNSFTNLERNTFHPNMLAFLENV